MKTMGTLLLAGVLLTAACSTQSKTTRTDSGGVIRGAVDIVGKTLALPFRVVGGLINLAF
jgi:hypothetical protein